MKTLLYTLLTLLATGMMVLRVMVFGWYLIMFFGLLDLITLGLHLWAGHRIISRAGGQFDAADWLAFGLMNGLYFVFFAAQGDGGDTGGTTTVWEKMTGKNAITDFLYSNWVTIFFWSGVLLLVTYVWVLFFRK